jgi:type III secretion system FlhB-like substrate exporter
VLYPWRANNYVGSKSLEENLLLMLTDRVKVSKLDEESLYNFLLELPLNEVIRDKIYEIVTRRFSYAYNICAP